MANRFTRRNIFGRFDKLSLDELSFLPMSMQQAHEQALAGAEGLRTYTNAVAQDVAYRDKLQGEINNGISDITDSLMSEGINPQVTQNLIKLKRRRDDLVNPGGDLYNIENEYNKLIQFRQKLHETENLSLVSKQRYLRAMTEPYQGVEKGDSLSVPYIVQDADAVKIALDAVKDMPTSSIETELSKAGLISIGTNENGTKIYKYGKDTITATDPIAIQIVARGALLSSPELTSMMEREQYFFNTLGAENMGLGKGAKFEDYKNAVFTNAINTAVSKEYKKDIGIDVKYTMDRFNEGYYGISLMQDMLSRPTITNRDFATNLNYSEDAVDGLLDPKGTYKNKIVNASGQSLSLNEFIEYAKNNDLKSSIPFMESNLAGVKTTGSDEEYYTALYDYVIKDKGGDAFYESVFKDLGLADVALTQEEKQGMLTVAEQQLNYMLNDYNIKTGSNLTLEQFKQKVARPTLETMGDVSINTQRFDNVPLDIDTEQIMENKSIGNLRNRELVIFDSNGDEVVPLGEDALDYLQSNMKTEDIYSITGGDVITNYGSFTGGRHFVVNMEDGKTYNVYASPNQSEAADYYPLRALSDAAQTLEFHDGSFDKQGAQFAVDQNNAVKYVPYKTFTSNGTPVTLVRKYHIVQKDGQIKYQDITGDNPISLEQAQNEVYRGGVLPYARSRYMSNLTRKKVNTGQ